MDNRPIGVFDSGLGGLTAVKQLEQVLPGESLVYFGDTGRVPYGSRGKDTILRYARQDMDFLLAQNVKAVLAACGTVSSVARSVGEALSVPYIDVIGPSARAAAAATKNGKIGVIGTAATIASDSYRSALLRINHKLEVYPQACPLFVSLVESGFVSPQDEVTRLVAERYLAPMRAAGVDTLILGCTHYPIIAPTVAGVMGRGVTLIDSGREAALALAQALKERDLLCDAGHRRQASYFVTDTPENFLNVAELFLGHSVEGRTQRIDIESYPAETQGRREREC
ncbi:MAG: glutamate racemase [Acutalibacter sp.]